MQSISLIKIYKHFLLVTCCCIVLQAYAQPPGSLDPSFASGGIGKYAVGLTPRYDQISINAILSLPDGRIIFAGFNQYRMTATRVNADGSTDATFGKNGFVYIKNGIDDFLNSAVLQPDGKILLAGYSKNADLNSDFSVIRLNSDGSPDSSFAGDGKLLIPVGTGNDAANSIALQSDGKILLAGYSSNGSNNDFSVIRLNTDGKLDKTFDGDGKLFIPIGSGDDVAKSIALQNDGKILLAGYSFNGSNSNDFSIIRLNAKGKPDSSFNGNGKLLIAVGDANDVATSIALRMNGKIVLGGYSSRGNQLDFSVAQLKPNGTLDTSFKDGGKSLITVSGSDQAYSMVLQSDGKILIGGTSKQGTYHVSVIRLNSKGTLDRSFNGTGKYVTLGSTEYAYSMALQTDGKILLAGHSYANSATDFSAIRLNSDGTPDNSFDGDGKLSIPTQTGSDETASMALQSDGKLLLAGHSGTIFSVIRLNTDGTIDDSFGEGGKVLIPVTGTARAIAIQGDGKILLAGDNDFNYPYGDFEVVRLNPDGSLDNSFDTDGILMIPLGSWYDAAEAIALQTDGKILVAGYTDIGGKFAFAMVRLNPNGSLDNSFDTDGKSIVSIGYSHDWVRAITLQSDEKILVAGSSLYYDNDPDFFILRLNTNGSLDSSFDTDGKVLIQMGSNKNEARAIAVQNDGKILAAGYSYNGNNYEFAVARVNSDGGLDKTFNKSGELIIPFGSNTALIRSIALQNDGKMVLTGSSSSDFAMVRLNANGSFNENFGEAGKLVISTPFYNETAVASVLQPDGKLVVAGYGDADEPGSEFIAMRFICAANTIPFAKTSTDKSNASIHNYLTTKLVVPTLLHSNERWRIQGLPVHNNIVFTDVNGRILYRQTDYQNDKAFTSWAQGMYYYRISFINKEGKTEIFKGKLVLVQ